MDNFTIYKKTLCFSVRKLFFDLLMMVLIACLLSPVNGYFRYAYPLVLSTPVILTAVMMRLRSGKSRPAEDGGAAN